MLDQRAGQTLRNLGTRPRDRFRQAGVRQIAERGCSHRDCSEPRLADAITQSRIRQRGVFMSNVYRASQPPSTASVNPCR